MRRKSPDKLPLFAIVLREQRDREASVDPEPDDGPRGRGANYKVWYG